MTQRSTSQGQATTIQGETTAGANTATRVGTALKQLADQTVFIEDAATATPAALGVAAVGVATKFAREDHAHVMPRLDQVSAPTAAVALNGQEITGLATPTAATSSVPRSYVDQSMIVVWAATSAPLPAYTTSGGPGPGFTLTANANGAFPTLDGSATLVANDPLKGLFLLQNGASATDNDVYMLTAQGVVAVSPWTAVRYTGADTAAKIAGSKVRVCQGLQKRGAEYVYCAVAAITMGTTKLYRKRVDARIGPNEGARWFDDCRESAVGTNTFNPYAVRGASGTGANVLVATSGNSATLIGELSCNSGSTATARAGLFGAWTNALTQPDDGNTFTPATNAGFDVEARVQVPVLSTAAQEFAVNVFYTKQLNNSQKTPADGICFIYDRTSAVSTLNWLASLSSAGVGTPVDTGIAVVAGQYYRLRAVQDPGDPNIRFYIDGVLVSTQSANAPVGTPLGFQINAFKSVGTTTVNCLKIDWHSGETDTPEMRAT